MKLSKTRPTRRRHGKKEGEAFSCVYEKRVYDSFSELIICTGLTTFFNDDMMCGQGLRKCNELPGRYQSVSQSITSLLVPLISRYLLRGPKNTWCRGSRVVSGQRSFKGLPLCPYKLLAPRLRFPSSHMDLSVLPSIAARLLVTFSSNCMHFVSFWDSTSTLHSQCQASLTLFSAVIC